MNTPIIDMLHSLSKAAHTRFSMPGHKGIAPGDVFACDLTELEGADNLRMPSGVIRQSQELHASFTGAKSCFYLVGGSSAGVIAGLMAAADPGDKVLAARDFHVSAVSAFVLADIRPVYIQPDTGGQLPGVITPAQLRRAIIDHPDAKALFLTYPNYYGLCADLYELTAIAHEAGMTVVCDAAHAAAFDFSDILPMSPAQAGCDIWTASLHKTLTSLGQCAVLSLGAAGHISPGKVQSCLNMVQTTSPSYLLLASCESTLDYMRREGKEMLVSAVTLVEKNISLIEALGGYRCVTQDVPAYTGAADRDILRLVIDVTDRGVSGVAAAKTLAQSGIFVEAADEAHIILICTIADTPQAFARLVAALAKINGSNYYIRKAADVDKNLLMSSVQVCTARQAVFAPRRTVPLEQSVGYISATAAGAYPPAVPILLPGEQISGRKVEYLAGLRQSGYAVFGCDRHIEIAEV